MTTAKEILGGRGLSTSHTFMNHYGKQVLECMEIYVAQYKSDNDRLREALQNIIDSTDGNNPNEAVFYFTAINALNHKENQS